MTSTIRPLPSKESTYNNQKYTNAHISARPSTNLFRHNTTNHNPFFNATAGVPTTTSANVQSAPIAMNPPPHPPPDASHRFVRNPLHPSIIDKLDPAFVKLYHDYIANGPQPSQDINIVRSNYSALYSYATAPATGVGGIGETTVPGWEKYPAEINIRVYVPPGEEPGVRKVWPVHFNFHGGGWAVGDLETSAHICHHICASVPCCVIDIAYRLIPEFPFPTGIYDSLSAIAHILTNHRTFSIDPHNITLGGESSGGTVALVLAHMFRDAGKEYSSRLKGVVVGTPSISDVRKLGSPAESEFESMRNAEVMPLLDWRKLKWFDTFKWMSLSQQVPPQPGGQHVPSQGHDGAASRSGSSTPNGPQCEFRRPSHREMTSDVSWFSNVLSAPSFKDLPGTTYIATAEFDPLRDEAEAYAEKLRKYGNNVVTRRFEGVPHPFMHMDGVLRQGREYVGDVISTIRACLYPPNKEGEDEAKENDGAMKAEENGEAEMSAQSNADDDGEMEQ